MAGGTTSKRVRRRFLGRGGGTVGILGIMCGVDVVRETKHWLPHSIGFLFMGASPSPNADRFRRKRADLMWRPTGCGSRPSPSTGRISRVADTYLFRASCPARLAPPLAMQMGSSGDRECHRVSGMKCPAEDCTWADRQFPTNMRDASSGYRLETSGVTRPSLSLSPPANRFSPQYVDEWRKILLLLMSTSGTPFG